MKKIIIFIILLIPLFVYAQAPTNDSTKLTSPPNIHPLSMSSLYMRGGNASNAQVGFFDGTTGKWIQLITAYQFNHYGGSLDSTKFWLTNGTSNLTANTTIDALTHPLNFQGEDGTRIWQLSYDLSSGLQFVSGYSASSIASTIGISQDVASLNHTNVSGQQSGIDFQDAVGSEVTDQIKHRGWEGNELFNGIHDGKTYPQWFKVDSIAKAKADSVGVALSGNYWPLGGNAFLTGSTGISTDGNFLFIGKSLAGAITFSGSDSTNFNIPIIAVGGNYGSLVKSYSPGILKTGFTRNSDGAYQGLIFGADTAGNQNLSSTFHNGINFKPIQYDASIDTAKITGNPFALIDLQYFNAHKGGGSSYTAGNGLSLTGTIFKLDTAIAQTVLNLKPAVLAFTNPLYLKLAGGTMSGDIAMGNNSISGANDVTAVNFMSADNFEGNYFGGLKRSSAPSPPSTQTGIWIDLSGNVNAVNSAGTAKGFTYTGATPTDLLTAGGSHIAVGSVGATYTNGYGLGLTSFAFRVDTTAITDLAHFNGKIGTTVANALAGKQASLGFTAENVANKTATASSSTTTYPNWLGVENYASPITGGTGYIRNTNTTQTANFAISGQGEWDDVSGAFAIVDHTGISANDGAGTSTILGVNTISFVGTSNTQLIKPVASPTGAWTNTLPNKSGTFAMTSDLTAGTVTSVSGTTNRTTSTGGATPAIDISSTFEALLGKVASPLSQFASTTSAQLRTVLSDETGTGFAYFQGGDAGTPSALVGTNISGTAASLTAGTVTTNANLTGDVTSVGNATTLKNTGTASTYGQVTTDAQGRVSSGTVITPIANGGSGLSTNTAYALFTGGTTTGGVFQQVSGVGSSGNVLTSNGPSALPTWQAPGAAMSIGGAVTSGTVGSIPFIATGPVLAQNNTKLFWDNTNIRLGIGTGSPRTALDIVDNNTTNAFSFQNNNVSGAAGIDYYDNTSTKVAYSGYGNGSNFFPGEYFIGTNSSSIPIVFAPNATNALTLSGAGVANFPLLTATTTLGLDASKNVVSITNNGTGNVARTSGVTFTGTTTFAVTSFGLASKIGIVEGTGGRTGSATLVAGTVAVTITGLTTSSRAFLQRTTSSGTTLTIEYNAVCTSNTLTITADVAAGTINTADTSSLNYVIFN